MGIPQIPSVDSDSKQFPDAVRARIANNLKDVNTAEGSAVASIASSSATAANRPARLADSAAIDRNASQANAAVSWQDATAFYEPWANYSAWSSSTRQQLSAGRTYGNGQGGSSGICHAFPVSAGQSARILFDVQYVYDSTDSVGGIIVGVTSDAAGANMATGASTARGLYFSGKNLYSWDKGTQNLLYTFTADLRFTVTFTVESDTLTVTAHSTDDSVEVRRSFVRGTDAVNNIGILATDSRGTSGMSVGMLGARTQLPTTIPHTPEELAVRAHWSPLSSGNIRIAFPTTYDSRKPSPVAICFHGAGGTEQTYAPLKGSNATDTNQPLVAKALLAAGYIVVSATAPNTTTFGSDAGLTAYVAAYQFLRRNYSVGAVVLYGNSMGGQESLLTLTRDVIPARAWVGTSPVCNLANTYASATFTGPIKSAYGIAADGSDYATKTAGRDPVLLAGSLFRAIPMLFIAASDDSVIPKAQNTDVMAPILSTAGSAVTVVTATGNHGFDHTPYLSQIVAFFDAACGR